MSDDLIQFKFNDARTQKKIYIGRELNEGWRMSIYFANKNKTHMKKNTHLSKITSDLAKILCTTTHSPHITSLQNKHITNIITM